jgi:hypothetical protein
VIRACNGLGIVGSENHQSSDQLGTREYQYVRLGPASRVFGAEV